MRGMAELMNKIGERLSQCAVDNYMTQRDGETGRRITFKSKPVRTNDSASTKNYIAKSSDDSVSIEYSKKTEHHIYQSKRYKLLGTHTLLNDVFTNKMSRR
jgi:hypothetical protein